MKLTTLTLAAATALATATGASALSVAVSFPAPGATYFSATNGGGVLTPGGETVFMWTNGDNITGSVTPGLGTVTNISGEFTVYNILGTPGLDDLNVDVIINGFNAGSVFIPGTNFSGTYLNYAYSFGVAPAAIGPNYTISYVLANTIRDGGGSIKFVDGGRVVLEGGVVPEPASWAMMIAGFGLVGFAARQRRRNVVAA